jgi:hypothetical protein
MAMRATDDPGKLLDPPTCRVHFQWHFRVPRSTKNSMGDRVTASNFGAQKKVPKASNETVHFQEIFGTIDINHTQNRQLGRKITIIKFHKDHNHRRNTVMIYIYNDYSNNVLNVCVRACALLRFDFSPQSQP